jgi:sugar phosphate isomerase/epimerase
MSVLRALRLPHWLAIGAVAAVLGAGVPSNWFGLVSPKISEVERLRSCMEKHGADLASLVTTLGEPQQILGKTPAERKHAVRIAERRHELRRRQGDAVVACARTVTG